MITKIIDGRKIAKEITESLKTKVEDFIQKNRITPKLAVIIVGEDPASLFYVKMIDKTCERVSISFKKYNLSEETSPEELLKLINNLNKDKEISGIIMQVPLPKHINQDQIQEAVNPFKDVDCFNPFSLLILYFWIKYNLTYTFYFFIYIIIIFFFIIPFFNKKSK